MQNGTFTDTPGDAPDLEDDELRMPLATAPNGPYTLGSDTRALLPQVRIHLLLAHCSVYLPSTSPGLLT